MELRPRALLLSTVWPEPESSAAGVRTLSLAETLRGGGYEVHVASASKVNAHAERLSASGFGAHSVQVNDSGFDAWIAELAPTVVVFDRFILEEQFGWRVHSVCPPALRVIDTQDLHFVRRARGRNPEIGFPESELSDSADALRELSAILRSDLSLILSSWESSLLRRRLGVSPDLLLDLPIATALAPRHKDFGERAGYAWIGNFRHPPNADAVQWMGQKLWPEIRALQPDAVLNVYGAYPSREAMALHSPREGFLFHGQANSTQEALAGARVNLAPLRFGAGIKGKILEGWRFGTPCAASPIAAEGMAEGLDWGGAIAELDPAGFARVAVTLHENERDWSEASARGAAILKAVYDPAVLANRLLERMETVLATLVAHRRSHWIGRALWLQQYRSTEYFSRWIESKEKSQSLPQSYSRSSLAP